MSLFLLLLGCGSSTQVPEVCEEYLDCVAEVAPGASEELSLAFGRHGSCWTSGAWASADCTRACSRDLTRLAVAHPDEPECRPEDACSRAAARVASCTDEPPDLQSCPTVSVLDDWHSCVDERLSNGCDWEGVAACERPGGAPVPVLQASVVGDWSLTPGVVLDDSCGFGLSPPIASTAWLAPEGAGLVWRWTFDGQPVTLGCGHPSAELSCEAERDGWLIDAEVAMPSADAALLEVWLESPTCHWSGLVTAERSSL